MSPSSPHRNGIIRHFRSHSTFLLLLVYPVTTCLLLYRLSTYEPTVRIRQLLEQRKYQDTMSLGSIVTFHDGNKMPQIGLGTWLAKPQEVEKAVEVALKNGYTHLDLAHIYGNQDEVAAGIKNSGVNRSDIFITSKLWNTWHRPDQAEKNLDRTLKELETDYLDLYLIHWPVAFVPGTGKGGENENMPAKDGKALIDEQTSVVDTWKAMIALQKTGKVKSIGVSNFQIDHLEAIIKATGVVPAVNQIERHPLLVQGELLSYCASKQIHITAYSPLGNNVEGLKKVVEYPEVIELAKKKGVDPAQVLIAWGKKGGHSVIPKSVTPSRIKSNFQEVELTDAEFESLLKIGTEHRFNVPIGYQPKWDINVFDTEAEKSARLQVKVA